jgi:DNA repair exonuclease SbcCD ATPase subunit
MAHGKQKDGMLVVSDDEVSETQTQLGDENQTQIDQSHPLYHQHYHKDGSARTSTRGEGGSARTSTRGEGAKKRLCTNAASFTEQEGQPTEADLAAEALAQQRHDFSDAMTKHWDQAHTLKQSNASLQANCKRLREANAKLQQDKLELAARMRDEESKLEKRQAKIGPQLEAAEAQLAANQAQKKALNDEFDKLARVIKDPDDGA